VGLDGHRGAPGAKVRVYAAGTQELLWYEEIGIYCRQVQPSYGYHFAETERHYGLGARDQVDVSVEFYPSRKLVTTEGVAANSTVRIGEDGEGVILPPAGGAGGSGGSGGSGASGGTSGAGGAGASGGTLGSGGTPTGGASGSGGQNAADGSSANGSDDGGCACRTRAMSTKQTSSAPFFAAFAMLMALIRFRSSGRRVRLV
jgi:hypothetical protein